VISENLKKPMPTSKANLSSKRPRQVGLGWIIGWHGIEIDGLHELVCFYVRELLLESQNKWIGPTGPSRDEIDVCCEVATLPPFAI